MFLFTGEVIRMNTTLLTALALGGAALPVKKPTQNIT